MTNDPDREYEHLAAELSKAIAAKDRKTIRALLHDPFRVGALLGDGVLHVCAAISGEDRSTACDCDLTFS